MKSVRVARKVFLVTGTICFLSIVTGATLYLHLLSHELADGHNHEKCPVCTHLLIQPHKFLHSFETPVIYSECFISDPVQSIQIFLQTIQLKTFNPRPPPALSILSITFS